MKVELIDLVERFKDEKKELKKCFIETISKGHLILTSEVKNFEDQICKYTGVKYCLGLNSGTDALMMALWCLKIGRGDEVITTCKSFVATIASIVHVGAKPILVDVNDDLNIDVEEIEKKITPKTKAIVICNPGNPTGYLYSKSELEQLRDIVKKHDLILFADEVYREFCYDGAVPFSVMNLEGIENNVIMIDSVSKRYSMCGARIGAMISKNKEIMNAALKFGQARLSPPTVDQIAAEAALNTPQSYFDDVVSEYVKRRDIMVDGLNAIPGVFCPKPSGAFYCVAKFPVDDAEKFCQWLLEEFSFEGQTVMMAPANGFYSTKGAGQQEARIAYVLNQDALRNAVKCLEEALKVYPGRI